MQWRGQGSKRARRRERGRKRNLQIITDLHLKCFGSVSLADANTLVLWQYPLITLKSVVQFIHLCNLIHNGFCYLRFSREIHFPQTSTSISALRHSALHPVYIRTALWLNMRFIMDTPCWCRILIPHINKENPVAPWCRSLCWKHCGAGIIFSIVLALREGPTALVTKQKKGFSNQDQMFMSKWIHGRDMWWTIVCAKTRVCDGERHESSFVSTSQWWRLFSV